MAASLHLCDEFLIRIRPVAPTGGNNHGRFSAQDWGRKAGAVACGAVHSRHALNLWSARRVYGKTSPKILTVALILYLEQDIGTGIS